MVFYSLKINQRAGISVHADHHFCNVFFALMLFLYLLKLLEREH